MLKLHFEFWVKTFIHIYFPFSHPGGNQNYFLRIWENVNARVCRATFFSLMCALHFELSTFFPPLPYHPKKKKNPEWAIVFLNFSRQSKKWFLNFYARNSRNILNLTKNFLEPKKDSNTSVENNKFYLRFHYYDFTCNTNFYFIFSTCMLALMYDSFFCLRKKMQYTIVYKQCISSRSHFYQFLQ